MLKSAFPLLKSFRLTLNILTLSLFGCLLCQKTVLAGMPQPELTDIAKFRFETISFFLMGFLICSLVIQKLWNYLKKDFSFLPLLSYKKSLALTGLWGITFMIVLTMISGARELMTPGAWEKRSDSSLYQLKDEMKDQDPPEDQQAALLFEKRKVHLEKLQGALWYYASTHDGSFPASIQDSGFPEDIWNVPEQFKVNYEYVPDLKPTGKEEPVPLIREPDLFDDGAFVLFSNGVISLNSPQTEIETIETGPEAKGETK